MDWVARVSSSVVEEGVLFLLLLWDFVCLDRMVAILDSRASQSLLLLLLPSAAMVVEADAALVVVGRREEECFIVIVGRCF